MLLATSHPHWWSNYRCVLLERIDEQVAVHDLGLGLDSSCWVPYPVLPHLAGRAASAGGELTHQLHDDDAIRHYFDDSGIDLAASSIADLLSTVIVDRLLEQRVDKLTVRIRDLLRQDPRTRSACARSRLGGVRIERLTDASEARWILAATKPRTRLFVAAAPSDVGEVEARLMRLCGS